MSEIIVPPQNRKNGLVKYNDDSGGKLRIDGKIVVEVDNVTFHLTSSGNSVVVSFDRLSNALKLINTIRMAFSGAVRIGIFMRAYLMKLA